LRSLRVAEEQCGESRFLQECNLRHDKLKSTDKIICGTVNVCCASILGTIEADIFRRQFGWKTTGLGWCGSV